MKTPYLYVLRGILAISDLVLFNLSLFVGFHLSAKIGNYLENPVSIQDIVICNLIWFITTLLFRLYSEEIIFRIELIYRASWRSIALHAFLFLSYLFFFSKAPLAKEFIVCFYSLIVFGFLLSRFTGTALHDFFITHVDVRKAVAIIGLNQDGIELSAYLEKQSSINFVGFLDEEGFSVDNTGELLSSSIPFRKASEMGVKEVYVSLTPERLSEMPNLMIAAEKECLRLKFVPVLTSGHGIFQIENMGGFPIICARKAPLEEIENRFKKRIFDVVFSLIVILFIFSWLYPILALLIKLQSPGPVLFKQLRTGRDNNPFWCYKFRSMRLNTDSDKRQASKHDDRITSLGKFMRRTSLDELPQFFNVLLGHMSVNGPRPHMVSHTEQYRKLIDKYMVRQFLKPGISGWAQVNGFRGETKEQELMEKRVEHDIWYMENWSAMLDVRIIFMTIINIIRGEKNAY
ncbi:exopolysaccharide biosynthesis polyprenyl glycosylphosphotransferase [Pedobacter sp. P351]|uniref:exopolysaccharide biosynthesis polyprenyl glycosylphosphotransferase n=1 Tax=Pedobacter superstes TaxID=3133441 RepID=UPI0030AA3676